MTKETENLHFTLGDNAGKLIMEIAQETLTIQLEPEKALGVITDSLVDIPEQIALDILVGKRLIVVNDDHVSVNVIDRDQEHSDYPILIPSEWARHKNEEMLKDAGDLCDFTFDVLRSVSEDSSVSVSIDILDFVDRYNAGDFQSIADEIYEMPEIDRVVGTISVCKKFLEKYYKAVNVLKFLATYYDKGIFVDDELSDYAGIIAKRISLFSERNYSKIKAAVTIGMPSGVGSLERYMASQHEISEIIENGIKPVRITDDYDAGWLSPDGTFYGLNGEIANMLHIQIADALKEAGVLPEDIGIHSPDGWMSEHGWVKIHDDRILYDGYMQAAYGMEFIPLTEAQIKEIARYGNVCCSGFLRFGLKMSMCSAALFETCNESTRAQLLDYEGINTKV